MKVGRTLKASLMLGVTALLAPMSRGTNVNVPNNSFEQPAPLPPGGIQADYSPDWTMTGPTGTGVFGNLTSPETYMVGNTTATAEPIYNADGSNLAYISAQYDPNNVTGSQYGPAVNQIYQTLPSTYQPGQAYTLMVGVAVSSVEPPPTGAILRLELYYGNLLPVATTLVTYNGTDLYDDDLTYIPVQAPAVLATDAWANQPIGILMSTTDNNAQTGGDFDLDNVSVIATSAQTPEPASAAVLAVGAAGLMLRRRRSRA